MDEEELLHEAERLFLSHELETAFHLFEQLAEAGNGRAMYFLGEYYARGFYVEQDMDAAYQWRERGAEAGDVLARLNTAYRFPEGSEEREEIIEKSLTLLRLLAIMDDVFAAFELADVYRIKGEEEEAQRLLEIAAEQGYWRAMNKLGNMLHRQGRYEKANEWYKKAGEAGFDWGWYNLGDSYQKGEGVAKNAEKAIECFERAADMEGAAAFEARSALIQLLAKSFPFG